MVRPLQRAADMAKKPKPQKINRQNYPQSLRHRKKVQVSLPDDVRKELARRGQEHQRGQSGVVEDLVRAGMTEKS